MRRLISLILAVMLIGHAQFAMAYPAKVDIRDFNSKRATDDLIVIDVTNVGRDQTTWFNTPFSPQVQSVFQIRMVNGTVALVRTPPYYEGMVTSLAVISSLDKLHDLTTSSGSARYDMRAYMTPDFLWIEVWPTGLRNSTVRSTVFFVGSNNEVYQYLLNNRNAGIRYANLAELKADIQNNYATPFNPRMPDPFLYTAEGWAAVISSLQSKPLIPITAKAGSTASHPATPNAH